MMQILQYLGVPASLLMFSQGLFSVILGLGVSLCDPNNYKFHGFTGKWEEYVCIIGVCCIGFVSQWTLTRGGQLLIAGLASLMRATDIAWAFLWGALFFSEIPNYLTVIGGVTMFASIFMVSLEKIKKLRQDKIDEIKNNKSMSIVDISC